MLFPLPQKTCCRAAHSALAQVMTIASAAGSVLDEWLISCGATCPAWPQSMAGRSGVFLIVGSKLLCSAEANSRAGL